MQNKLFKYALFFLIFLVLLQFFSPAQQKQINTVSDITITSKSNFPIGKEVVMTIENFSAETITVKKECPKNPLIVELYKNGEWVKKEATLKDLAYCDKLSDITIEPKAKTNVSFGLWTTELFSEAGHYRVTFETTLGGKVKDYYQEIDITPPSFIKRIWTESLYKPIFNTLIFFVSKIPGHDLGLAIILLTLLIKLILLVPNQKALRSQKQLQIVQPQLDALKLKYKNDPQLLAKETMEIWKKYKVSPLGSCLPMLIQFPILIALFYVVRDGLNIMDPSLFYAPLKDFSLESVNPVFLGIIDLTKANTIVLPIIIGGLQFLQIRLSLAKATTGGSTNAAMPMMNNMMKYFLPVMIAVFTASLPAAVGFYWGTSTLFAIGQQMSVNKAKIL
jgi:YidC/Oxa1 family membrane protein insertase